MIHCSTKKLYVKKSRDRMSHGTKNWLVAANQRSIFKSGYRHSCAARSKLEGMKFDASKWRSYKNTLPPFGAL